VKHTACTRQRWPEQIHKPKPKRLVMLRWGCHHGDVERWTAPAPCTPAVREWRGVPQQRPGCGSRLHCAFPWLSARPQPQHLPPPGRRRRCPARGLEGPDNQTPDCACFFPLPYFMVYTFFSPKSRYLQDHITSSYKGTI